MADNRTVGPWGRKKAKITQSGSAGPRGRSTKVAIASRFSFDGSLVESEEGRMSTSSLLTVTSSHSWPNSAKSHPSLGRGYMERVWPRY